MAMMLSHCLPNDLIMNSQYPQHTGFVSTHLAAEAHDVGEHNGGQAAGLASRCTRAVLGHSRDYHALGLRLSNRAGSAFSCPGAPEGVKRQQALTKLVEAEVLYQRGLPPQACYLFKHALLQDVAYQSLLKSTRQRYHQQIAQVLEEQFAELTETQPELLAHHYTEAGLIKPAIPYWQQAGERASQRSAYVEAANHLMKGLEVLKALPNTPERIRQELTLQLALSDALLPVNGYAASELEKPLLPAWELCQHLGEAPQLPSVLFRLFVFYFIRAELHTARELAEQIRRLAQSIQDPYLLSLTSHSDARRTGLES